MQLSYTFRSLYTLILLLICYATTSYAHNDDNASHPLYFIPNKGQWQAPFLFKGVSAGSDIYIEQNGVTFVTGAIENNHKLENHKLGLLTDFDLKYHAYKLQWINNQKDITVEPTKQLSHYNNYYLGNNPKHWQTNVPLFEGLTLKNVFKNIDVYYYSEGAHPKYDFIVQANANPKQIQFKYNGVNNIHIKNKQLVVETSVGDIIESAPYAYQTINGQRVEVKCDYVLNKYIISFNIGNYNKNYPLIIDPEIVFASLSGSTADNWGFSATYDNLGNLYAGGIARGVGYPTSLGAFQVSYQGGDPNSNNGTDCDIAISKFNATGNALLYSTYIGGNGNEMPHSLVVDNQGNLIISGKSNSSDYPTTTTAYDTSHNGNFDIVITKLNATGTALVGSTYVGGASDDGVNINANYNNYSSLKYNYGDDSRSEVIVDNNNNIYVATSTRSSGFPTTATAFKTSLTGTQDGVFLKFNPTLSNLIYSTLIGGNDDDAAYSLLLNNAQSEVYITGGTKSPDFHLSALQNGYQSTLNGNIDGFVLRINNSGTYNLLGGTYIGTSAYDQCYGIQHDNSNNIIVMGQTLGGFPVSSGVYSNPGGRQFIMKLNNTLTTNIWSTRWGVDSTLYTQPSYPNLSPVAFLVDTCENIYISGWGGLTSSAIGSSVGTHYLPVTANTLQAATDGSDFYFIVLANNASSLLYGGYFGAVGKQEHVDGGTSRFDPNGVIYQSMCASCGTGSSFPATTGAYATVKGGSNCNIGVVKMKFNLGSVSARANASPDTVGCAPFTVTFTDSSSNVTQYNWNFGDGTTSTLPSPTHTFNTPGTYQVTLSVFNPDACFKRDTARFTILVKSDTIHADFNINVLDSCITKSIQLSNQSLNNVVGTPTTYNWDFGDGTTFTGPNPPVHNYANYGQYTITLTATNADACNNPSTMTKTVNFDSNFVNVNLSSISVCGNEAINFNPTYSNATSYNWDFGDGTNSQSATPAHAYNAPGIYNVSVIAINDSSCNKRDTASITVTVNDIPNAGFTYSPGGRIENEEIQFNNTTTGATQYNWSFGDGTTSTLQNPTHTYLSTSMYTVCLTATNMAGCKDTVCKTLDVVIIPLVDVPTGFSPNNDGNNDKIYVRGYGIKSIDWKIYNRWGQLVFMTSDLNTGWDGTFKGEEQPMEVYGYNLTVEYVNGERATKQGNITLLR